MTAGDKTHKEYRRRLGLTSQSEAKGFFAARDMEPDIDLGYVGRLSSRVEEIVRKLNGEIHPSARWVDMDDFCRRFVQVPTATIVSAGLLGSMNNQGRRPEQVFFSWLRGYSLLEFFTPALARVFGVPLSGITRIGDDDLSNPETFRRTARADLELALPSGRIRVEAQTGLQGVNDVKEHKVRESRAAWSENRVGTVCSHFDVYNGRAALVPLHEVPDEGVAWVTRPQMEGQRVLAIDDGYFRWNLSQPPPSWPEGWVPAK
jgi:hypothetical protein